MATDNDFLRLLERWIPTAERRVRKLPGREDLLVYGPETLESWDVQAHASAFTAFAELAANPHTDINRTGMTRDDLWWHAFKMLRFILQEHVSAKGAGSAKEQWGHSWNSALCLERMMFGVEDMEIYLKDEDHEALCRVLTSEADWLLDTGPVIAGLDRNNRPESNMWNGCLLTRAALLYPDLPRAHEYLEKGTAFLLNAASFPQDQDSADIYSGRTLDTWHVGANFLSTGACPQQGYLNVGSLFVILSNLAMLHFSGQHFDWELPPALYLHVKDLCRIARPCIFPDGRLLRMGGDRRVRYCGAQDYALAAWMLLRDRLAVREADDWENGWLRQVGLEQAENGDGAFLGRRLQAMKETSPVQYARLEGARAATLAMGACWHRRTREFSDGCAVNKVPEALTQWNDDSLGAFLCRSKERIVTWTWQAAEAPQGLCVPTWRSDMAEWRFNLAGRIQETGVGAKNKTQMVHQESLRGGFVTSGWVEVHSQSTITKGEDGEAVARIGIACAALPDGQTTMVLQQARALASRDFREIKGLFLNLPNDLFNGGMRHIEAEKFRGKNLRGPSDKEEVLTCGRWLNVDGCLTVRALDGQSLFLHRSGQPDNDFKHDREQLADEDQGRGLYADEVCQGACHEGAGECHEEGEELFRVAVALRTGVDVGSTETWCKKTLDYECVMDKDALVLHGGVWGADGKGYVLVFNGDTTAQHVSIGTQKRELSAGESWLLTLD